MVLNNKPQMFTFYFPSDFWYPEVVEQWTPMVRRMKLPYETVEDFMNAQIQAVTFPSMNLDLAVQGRWQYEVAYYGGKELEPLIDKNLKITFKLTESYLSYWIVWHQIDTFLHYASEYREKKVCWLPPVKLGFLTDAGIQLLDFTFNEITPEGTSELNLSYAATVASYNTFTLSLRYNTFSVDKNYTASGEISKPKIAKQYELTDDNTIESKSSRSSKPSKQNHDELGNLDYAHSGHTGFQKKLTPGEHITIGQDGKISADFLSKDDYNKPNGIPQLDEDSKIKLSQIQLPLEVFNGYYSDGIFYSDAEHTIQIEQRNGSLYIDLNIKSIYICIDEEYIPVGGKEYKIKGEDNKLILSDDVTSSIISAGDGISISNNIIKCEQKCEWGSINGEITDQEDLIRYIDEQTQKLKNEHRYKYDANEYKIYNAIAPYGSLDNDDTWTITISTTNANGSIIDKQVLYNQIWQNYTL